MRCPTFFSLLLIMRCRSLSLNPKVWKSGSVHTDNARIWAGPREFSLLTLVAYRAVSHSCIRIAQLTFQRPTPRLYPWLVRSESPGMVAKALGFKKKILQVGNVCSHVSSPWDSYSTGDGRFYFLHTNLAPTLVFVNKVLLEHSHTHLFTSCFLWLLHQILCGPQSLLYSLAPYSKGLPIPGVVVAFLNSCSLEAISWTRMLLSTLMSTSVG